MINPSNFIYSPHSERGFLMLSRYGKEEEVTEAFWRETICSVSEKVFTTIREKYNLCTCLLECIQFVLDGTEVGISLKKLDPRLPGVSRDEVDKVQQTTDESCSEEVLDNVRNSLLCDMESITLEQVRQIELNEFAVKTLCKVSIEFGIDKKTIFFFVLSDSYFSFFLATCSRVIDIMYFTFL